MMKERPNISAENSTSVASEEGKGNSVRFARVQQVAQRLNAIGQRVDSYEESNPSGGARQRKQRP